MMDFREAKACLDEYRDELLAICRVLDTDVTLGEQWDAAAKVLISHLNELTLEAVALTNKLTEEVIAIVRLPDFQGEINVLGDALAELRAAIIMAAEAKAKFLQKLRAENTKQDNGMIRIVIQNSPAPEPQEDTPI